MVILEEYENVCMLKRSNGVLMQEWEFNYIILMILKVIEKHEVLYYSLAKYCTFQIST